MCLMSILCYLTFLIQFCAVLLIYLVVGRSLVAAQCFTFSTSNCHLEDNRIP